MFHITTPTKPKKKLERNSLKVSKNLIQVSGIKIVDFFLTPISIMINYKLYWTFMMFENQVSLPLPPSLSLTHFITRSLIVWFVLKSLYEIGDKAISTHSRPEWSCKDQRIDFYNKKLIWIKFKFICFFLFFFVTKTF